MTIARKELKGKPLPCFYRLYRT